MTGSRERNAVGSLRIRPQADIILQLTRTRKKPASTKIRRTSSRSSGVVGPSANVTSTIGTSRSHRLCPSSSLINSPMKAAARFGSANRRLSDEKEEQLILVTVSPVLMFVRWTLFGATVALMRTVNMLRAVAYEERTCLLPTNFRRSICLNKPTSGSAVIRPANPRRTHRTPGWGGGSGFPGSTGQRWAGGQDRRACRPAARDGGNRPRDGRVHRG